MLRQIAAIGTGWNQLAISGDGGHSTIPASVCLPAGVPAAVNCHDVSPGSEGRNRVGCSRDFDVDAGPTRQVGDHDAIEVDLENYRLRRGC